MAVGKKTGEIAQIQQFLTIFWGKDMIKPFNHCRDITANCL